MGNLQWAIITTKKKRIMKFLLYGANGYTGQLILNYASDFDLTPVLAGRNELKIKPLAEEFDCEYLIFDLDNRPATEEALADFEVVLHVAGPFKYTAKQMIEACIDTNTHYLDITGEIEVFELANTYDEQAKAAGVMLLPGTGFDVVPTDCTAVYLKNQMPDATHLELAFANVGGSVSHGTAMTMIENLGSPSMERQNGKIVEVTMAKHCRWIDFPEKRMHVGSIPWGDVSTAFYSTGIPNIITYTGMPPSQARWMRWSKWFGWLVGSNLVKNYARKKVKSLPAGPSDKKRATAKSLVWGKVKNANGESKELYLTTPEGYTLTAKSSLSITRKVLSGNAPIGFQTPAKAYGADLIMEFAMQ